MEFVVIEAATALELENKLNSLKAAGFVNVLCLSTVQSEKTGDICYTVICGVCPIS